MRLPFGQLTLALHKALWIVFIASPLAAMVTWVVLYSTHSLAIKNEWIVQKGMLEFGVMGSDEFLLTRAPLAQNRLNLGAYYGFQEVLTRRVMDPREIIFDFELPQDTYLDITFNRQDQGFSGLRLSRNSRIQAQWFESDRKGQFTRHLPYHQPHIVDGWHRARLFWKDHKITLILDANPPIEVNPISFQPGRVGFRSGYAGALIRDVKIGENSGQWTSLSFYNTKGWLQLFVLNLLLIAAIGTFFIYFPFKSQEKLFKRQLLAWIASSVAGLICFLVWYIFDYYYYSPLIYERNGITQRLWDQGDTNERLSFEEVRYAFFKNWYQLVVDDQVSHEKLVNQGYPETHLYRGPIYCGPRIDVCQFVEFRDDNSRRDERKRLVYRVVFIGTSQTIGVGANRVKDTFFSLIHNYVSERLDREITMESINMAVAGSNAKELLPDYRKRYLPLKPDLVVINLSTNDSNEEFEGGITAFLELNKAAGIRTILLEEAVLAAPETWMVGANLAKHETLRKIAKRYHVLTYPLHQLLNDPNLWNTGTVWWDPWHLTSYGHELVAENLGPFIYETLTQTKPQRRRVLSVK